MRIKIFVASVIVGLIVPSLAAAQHVKTFRASVGAAVQDANGAVHGA